MINHEAVKSYPVLLETHSTPHTKYKLKKNSVFRLVPSDYGV